MALARPSLNEHVTRYQLEIHVTHADGNARALGTSIAASPWWETAIALSVSCHRISPTRENVPLNTDGMR